MPHLRSSTVTASIAIDPLWIGPAADTRPTTEDRYWQKVDVNSQDECWPWTSTIDSNGYGVFHLAALAGKPFTMRAHRFAYVLAYGDCDPGLHIHHNCQNRGCVNPRHLSALTPREHVAWHRARR